MMSIEHPSALAPEERHVIARGVSPWNPPKNETGPPDGRHEFRPSGASELMVWKRPRANARGYFISALRACGYVLRLLFIGRSKSFCILHFAICNCLRLIAFALLLAAGPGISLAQRDLKDIPPPDPEEERRTFQVAEGFEVNLFAADPLLAKPIQMNFDPQGRLWVASSEIYPQIKPGQKANDKILVLEDTDGDGKADKTTVFADGLLIPTGIEPGDRRRLRRQQHRAAAPYRHRRRRQGRHSSGSCSPASAPRTRTTSSTRSAGGRTGCSTSTSRSTSTATSRRRTACAG